MRVFFNVVMLILCLSGPALAADSIPGLLFHLSGDGPGDGFTADYAFGDPEPAYLKEMSIIPDGAVGRAFYAPSAVDKLLVYPAPGNIYTQRGTLSFFFRNQYPVGETAFKLFYVSYVLNSCLDMTWLRVDYNGRQGWDAFVTDANMARIRVSYTPPKFPEPDEWTHFALAWDEAEGIRFYVNGELAAEKDSTVVLDAGLAFLKPYGRFATPGTATDSCGHIRGGDVDEIVVYDSMLTPDQVKLLAGGTLPGNVHAPERRMTDSRYSHEWLFRHGWDNGTKPPVMLDGSRSWTVRKVEILDARDQKKWSWRANDGMRESVWPDVYNRSSLPGRTDYFIEPDWYCYSTSGKKISFSMPDEPFNYIEMSGAAYGKTFYETLDTETREHAGGELFSRPEGRERTFHKIDGGLRGGAVHYVNDVRETPLSEFNAMHVSAGQEPVGVHTMSYTITNYDEPKNNALNELKDYIVKRLPADERTLMLALPQGAPREMEQKPVSDAPLPVVNVIVPFRFSDEAPRTVETGYGGYRYTWQGMYAGLDGIAIDIPALDIRPTHNGYIPMNITIKDPLWPNRSMMDFSFSVKPGEAKTVFFDTRDRVLPDHSLYIVISSASGDFGAASLEGANIRLIFKDYKESIAEHTADRFAQVRDLFAADLSETFPKRLKQDHLKRFERDMLDLFKVAPDHNPGRYYWKRMHDYQYALPFEQPKAPAGVPLWAFRQVEVLKQWHKYLDWWIDNRQIENGEFGGGLSDDGDFANCMPPLALMGVIPEKITGSMRRFMDAYYENGMFTNGLNTIVTDALHVAEEGTNVQSELMLLAYGDPKLVERMMETSARYPDFFKVNDAGHRHITSSFYSSTYFATEEPWCWSSRHTSTVLYPGINLVDFNGSPGVMQVLREYAEGLLAHGRRDANGALTMPNEINFLTDDARDFGRGRSSRVFEALYNWTGEDTFREPGGVSESSVHPFTNKDGVAESYASTIQFNEERWYIATDGFPWDDGPYLDYGRIIDDRLGGSPVRRSSQYASNPVSWEFDSPHSGESIAALVPRPSRTSVKIVTFNLERETVTPRIVGRMIEPGIWEIRQGIDTDGDDIADSDITVTEQRFGRTEKLAVPLPARKTTVIEMTLKTPGTPYWKRQDLGIGPDDIAVKGRNITVTVHNVGSIESAKTPLCLVAANGEILDSETVSPLPAPLDLKPKTKQYRLSIPRGLDMSSLSVVIDPERTVEENTRMNNCVKLTSQK